MAGLIANCQSLGNEASFCTRIDMVGNVNMNIMKTLINLYSVTSLAPCFHEFNLHTDMTSSGGCLVLRCVISYKLHVFNL